MNTNQCKNLFEMVINLHSVVSLERGARLHVLLDHLQIRYGTEGVDDLHQVLQFSKEKIVVLKLVHVCVVDVEAKCFHLVGEAWEHFKTEDLEEITFVHVVGLLGNFEF